MSATDRDGDAAEACHRARQILGPGASEQSVIDHARGREWASRELFVEAVRRGEDELLAVPRVRSFREDLVGIGISEAEARRQALDYGWELYDEARRRARNVGGAGGGGLAELAELVGEAWGSLVPENLTEADRQKMADGLGWDGERVVDEGKARRAVKGYRRGSRSAVRDMGRGAKPRSRELREVDDNDRFREAVEHFMNMGLSESAARHAARGRN